MTEQGDVRITQREVYDKVVSLEDGFGRVEALLEKHIALEEQRNEGIEVRLENHGSRLADQGTQIVALDGRVTQAESDLRSIKEAAATRDAKKTPWYNIVGAVGVIVTTVIALGSFAITNIVQLLSRVP